MKKSFSIENGIIMAYFENGGHWEVPLKDIAIIGEYTTEDGPLADDYFVCIIDKSDIQHILGSEEGAFELMKEISEKLKFDLDPKLMLSTDFSSRIMYPTSAKGKPLFDIVEIKPKSLTGRIRSAFFKKNYFVLSSDAENIIQQNSSNSGI